MSNMVVCPKSETCGNKTCNHGRPHIWKGNEWSDRCLNECNYDGDATPCIEYIAKTKIDLFTDKDFFV